MKKTERRDTDDTFFTVDQRIFTRHTNTGPRRVILLTTNAALTSASTKPAAVSCRAARSMGTFHMGWFPFKIPYYGISINHINNKHRDELLAARAGMNLRRPCINKAPFLSETMPICFILLCSRRQKKPVQSCSCWSCSRLNAAREKKSASSSCAPGAHSRKAPHQWTAVMFQGHTSVCLLFVVHN